MLNAGASRGAKSVILIAICRVTGWRFRSVNHLVFFIELILGAACTLDPLRDRAFAVTEIMVIIWTSTLMEGRRGSLEEGLILFLVKTLVLSVLLIVCITTGQDLGGAPILPFLA